VTPQEENENRFKGFPRAAAQEDTPQTVADGGEALL
jgi:hypothetical protein